MLLTEYDEDVIVAGYREEAYEDGVTETKEAAKKKMLAAGIPPKQIAEFLDLPESEVLKTESAEDK